MKASAYKKLLPFLHNKSARQRLILYLIADGYTVAELVAMRLYFLSKIELNKEMSDYRDELLANSATDMAFVYPNGNVLPHTAYYRIIRNVALKVLKRSMTQGEFRAFIAKE